MFSDKALLWLLMTSELAGLSQKGLQSMSALDASSLHCGSCSKALSKCVQRFDGAAVNRQEVSIELDTGCLTRAAMCLTFSYLLWFCMRCGVLVSHHCLSSTYCSLKLWLVSSCARYYSINVAGKQSTWSYSMQHIEVPPRSADPTMHSPSLHSMY